VFFRIVSAMTRLAICVMASPGRRFESPGGRGALTYPHSIRKQCGYGARLTRVDRSYPARGPRLRRYTREADQARLARQALDRQLRAEREQNCPSLEPRLDKQAEKG